MHLNDEETISDQRKDDIFNTFFHSVYTADPSCSPVWSSDQMPLLLTISSDDVYKALVSLDPFKAKGIDNISSLLLKNCAVAPSSPLHHLFKTSTTKESIQSEWRTN